MIRIFTILALIAFSFSVRGQQIIKISSSKYWYKNQGYCSYDMLHLFEEGTEAYELYEKSVKVHKNANTAVYLSGTLGVGSIIILREAFSSRDINVDLALFGILYLLVSPIPLITGIINAFRASYKHRTAIKMYNADYLQKNKLESDIGTLHLKLTGNGVGLVYSF